MTIRKIIINMTLIISIILCVFYVPVVKYEYNYESNMLYCNSEQYPWHIIKKNDYITDVLIASGTLIPNTFINNKNKLNIKKYNIDIYFPIINNKSSTILIKCIDKNGIWHSDQVIFEK